MEGVNRKQWLIDNKLEDAIHVFESRNVEVEELLEFDKEDLKAFAIDVLHLDVLARNRFLKAIYALQAQQSETTNTRDKQTESAATIPMDFNFNFNNSQTQSIIVSPQENQAKETLYQRNDEIAKLCYNLTTSIDNLEQSHLKMLTAIDHIFNMINTQLNQRKEILLSDIDRIQNQKATELSEQLSSLEQYVLILKDTKNKYYQHISDQTMDIRLRKKTLLKLVSNALKQHNRATHPSTAPNVQFVIRQKSWTHFLDHMRINNCDQPLSPLVSIKKCTATSITVQWGLNPHYTTNTINVQYALLSKSIHIEHNEMHNKHKTDSKHAHALNPFTALFSSMFGGATSKQNDGDIDTDSELHDADEKGDGLDSDSGSTHSSGYDTDSDIDTETHHKRKMKRKHNKKREKHHKEHALTLELPENVDTDALQWKKVYVKKKKDYRQITGLHHDRFYVFRVRGGNDNGWGSFSSCVVGKTEKLAFVSKIVKQGEQKKLLSILRKNKKCIRIKGRKLKGDIESIGWKLLFRASEYGFRSYDFYRKCVGKKNTLVIIQSATNVFGGYINIGWIQPPPGNWKYATDEHSFLFVLRSRNKRDIKGYNIRKNTAQYAICCWDQYGPCFGQNCEIAISNNCNANTTSYSSMGSFDGITNNSQLAGSQNFGVTDYEVWQLK